MFFQDFRELDKPIIREARKLLPNGKIGFSGLGIEGRARTMECAILLAL
jgi:hypothetical protein